jgi:hypothetical protein
LKVPVIVVISGKAEKSVVVRVRAEGEQVVSNLIDAACHHSRRAQVSVDRLIADEGVEAASRGTLVVSTSSVTAPLVPPPVRAVPALTSVIVPVPGKV